MASLSSASSSASSSPAPRPRRRGLGAAASAAAALLGAAAAAGGAQALQVGELHGLATKAAPFRVRLRRASAIGASSSGTRRTRRSPRSLLQLGAEAEAAGPASAEASGRPPADQLFGSLYVGLPPQEFTVAFDTGSGNIILPSKQCMSLACLSRHTYNSQLSGSARDIARVDDLQAPIGDDKTRESVTMVIGAGSVTGHLTSERVCLGPEENLCAQSGIIEAITMSDEPFGLLPYDGILGLGMPGVSLRKHFNFLGNLAGAGVLEMDRFAIWLAEDGDGEDSEITFGAADDERIGSPEIAWERLARPELGMWDLKMRDVVVAGKRQDLCGGKGCWAAFDSGTSVLGGPSAFVQKILAELKIDPACSNFDQLPTLGFAFGNEVFNLDPSDYVLRSGDTCFHQFMAIDVPPPKGPLVSLGAPFLRRYYTIYDRPTLKIGIALAKHKSDAQNSEQESARLITPFPK